MSARLSPVKPEAPFKELKIVKMHTTEVKPKKIRMLKLSQLNVCDDAALKPTPPLVLKIKKS